MHIIQTYLQKAIEEIGDDGAKLYESYSGRGMYGRNCIGITGSKTECNTVIGEAIKLAAADMSDEVITSGDFDVLIDKLLGHAEDSMGCDMIMYWPSVAFEGEVLEDADSTTE